MENPFDIPHEVMVIDADTILYKAAVVLEEKFITVRHKKTGKTQEFRNKTEFYGHHAKKAGGWLAEYNEKRLRSGLRAVKPESFDIEDGVRPNPKIENHLEFGLKNFTDFMKRLRTFNFSSRIQILLGGGGNFRDAVAQTKEYKGGRPPKPMFFQELKDLVAKKFKNQVELVYEREVDDRMAYYGYQNALNYAKTGKWKYVLAYIDKDLKMICSPAFNYDEEAPRLHTIDAEEAAKFYCMQLITGDSTDNILGLPGFTEEICTKYGIRRGKGTGEVGALKLLEECYGIAEYFDRVVEAYKSYYGEDGKPMTSWRGDVLDWNWKDYLNETALLIYMNPYDNPLSYDIIKHMEKIGVKL